MTVDELDQLRQMLKMVDRRVGAAADAISMGDQNDAVNILSEASQTLAMMSETIDSHLTVFKAKMITGQAHQHARPSTIARLLNQGKGV